MGTARFRRLCRARFQRAGPALLRSRAPLAHGAQARDSRSARQSLFRTEYASFKLRARTLFGRGRLQPAAERPFAEMTEERLPWKTADPASLPRFQPHGKQAAGSAPLW